jgi:hypothetical protein
MPKIFVTLLVLLGLAGLAVIFVFSKPVKTIDLGVSPSKESLASFLEKIGSAPPSGIMAGGMPISGSFTSNEVTSFLAAFMQKQKLPIQNLQVRFSEGFFEASAVVSKIVKGDVFVRGTIELRGPRNLFVRVQEITSNAFPISLELKDILQETLDKSIQELFDKFGPDERFLSIQTFAFQEDALLFEGVVPLEFLPSGSNIRF